MNGLRANNLFGLYVAISLFTALFWGLLVGLASRSQAWAVIGFLVGFGLSLVVLSLCAAAGRLGER